MLATRSFALALAACLVGLAPAVEEAPKKYQVYVGTYTDTGKSKGIYRLEFDPSTGKLSEPQLAARTVNPTFLALHPTGKYLYAVSETGLGPLKAYAIDPDSGHLTFLNSVSAGGGGPCHIIVDRAGKHVLAANYGGGSACVAPIEDDGKLGKLSGFVQHKGKSVNKSRQKAPHAHSINLDPANRFAFVADLGLDKVLIYRFEDGKLQEHGFASLKPGAGPRHFAFHPDGKRAYVINELASTLTAFRYDAKKGALEETQTISTLPEGYRGRTTTAEVVVHPGGKFVYGSNRGHDSIAVFRVEAETGKLTAAGHQKQGIRTPRNFALDPQGRWCLVANQDSDSLIVFRVDPETGALKPTDVKVSVPRPVCIRFLAWPR
jgi:6-phosphogluconolactonase